MLSYFFACTIQILLCCRRKTAIEAIIKRRLLRSKIYVIKNSSLLSNLTKVNFIYLYIHSCIIHNSANVKGFAKCKLLIFAELPFSSKESRRHPPVFCHHHVAKLPIRAHRHSQSVKIRTFLWSDLKREGLGFSWAYFFHIKDLLRCPSHVSELLNVHCRGWKIFWAFAASCHSRSESQEYQELIKGLGTSKSCL